MSVGRQGTGILHIVVRHVLSMSFNLLYTKPLLGLKKVTSLFALCTLYGTFVIDLTEQSLELLKTCMVEHLHSLHSA